MPCEDPYRSNTVYVDNPKVKKRLDFVTQNLCYLCANLMDAGLLEKYANKRILAWHKEHTRSDEKRVSGKMRAVYLGHPEYIETPEKVADNFIRTAEKVHPVSDYHKNWFNELAIREANYAKGVIAKRNKSENIRKKAINKLRSKLTKEERRSLGLEKLLR